MEVVNRGFDLKSFFPFDRCEKGVSALAMKLGRVVKYASGETLLQSGAPARHCGLILEGQAVAFKQDRSGRRYQLCLDEGCYIGLESTEAERAYTAKVTALTDLTVLFWNGDGIAELSEASPAFIAGLRMLDEGRVYQEQWLVPETDITDPVLCSRPTHWLSAGAPAFLILPLLLIALAACGILIRSYPVAWLLVFLVLGAAGTFLYRSLTARANERTVVTSRNMILVPRDLDAEMTVIRLREVQSLTVKKNFFEKLVNGGHILLQDVEREHTTPLLRDPELTASLLRSFAERNDPGKTIPLFSGRALPRQIPLNKTAGKPEQDSGQPEMAETKSDSISELLPPFTASEFHAHWMLLVRMALVPLIVCIAALLAALRVRAINGSPSAVRILLIAAAFAILMIVLRFDEWRGNRFRVEEDCVKDFSRKPFSKEALNIAMIPKIESVRLHKQGPFQLLFNYGTVYILAGESELDFEYVNDPKAVQKVILDACNRAETKRKLEEEAVRRAYVSDLVSEIRGEGSGPLTGNPSAKYNIHLD